MYCKTIFLFSDWYYSYITEFLSFRNNILEKIWKPIMAIDGKIRNERLQYEINREAAKTSALSSGKIDKYKCLQAKKYYLLIKAKS